MILLWVLAGLAEPSGTLVDRVVAVVDKEVITQNELLAEARVALAQREGLEAASAGLSAEVLTAFRVFLIDQLLVAEQARRMGAAEATEEEVDQGVRRLEQRFPSSAAYQAFLRRFGIPGAMIRQIVRRDLRNGRFIRDRLRLRLTGGAGGGEQKYAAALLEWMNELQAAAEIRLAAQNGELELQRGPLGTSQSTAWWK